MSHEDRKYIITFINDQGLARKELFYAIWNSLTSREEWLNHPDKIIMIGFINIETDKNFWIVRNVFLTNETTSDQYWELAKKAFQQFYDEGSFKDSKDYTIIQVLLWYFDTPDSEKSNIESNISKPVSPSKLKVNGVQKRGYSTYSHLTTDPMTLEHSRKMSDPDDKWAIKPLSSSGKSASRKMCTMDVETMQFDGLQKPVAISFSYKVRNKIYSFVTLIDKELVKIDREAAIRKLWTNFYTELESCNLGKHLVIFTHNLLHVWIGTLIIFLLHTHV